MASGADVRAEARSRGVLPLSWYSTNAVAMVALGRCYLLGQGVARSAEQARVCFTRSQAAGYDMAAKWLAYYFPPPPPEPARKVSIFDDVQRE